MTYVINLTLAGVRSKCICCFVLFVNCQLPFKLFCASVRYLLTDAQNNLNIE